MVLRCFGLVLQAYCKLHGGAALLQGGSVTFCRLLVQPCRRLMVLHWCWQCHTAVEWGAAPLCADSAALSQACGAALLQADSAALRMGVGATLLQVGGDALSSRWCRTAFGWQCRTAHAGDRGCCMLQDDDGALRVPQARGAVD